MITIDIKLFAQIYMAIYKVFDCIRKKKQVGANVTKSKFDAVSVLHI